VGGQVARKERHPLRTMPWWIAALGVVAVAAAATITTVWLLAIAGANAQLRIEAIKVGLSVGAGTGGAVALLLAVRRQWLSERTQAHAEDVARDTAHDATERRVTELYGKAVEQLGHVNAAVRLGGLYSLERLAQDHHEHRQTVVDVICAYLRMPFQPPSRTPAEEESPAAGQDADDTRHELQVRLAAQRLLARHLAPPDTQDAADGPAFWAGTRIDLVGAHLVDFDLSDCRPHDADFRTARFSGDAVFRGAEFSGEADFGGAGFNGDVDFGGAEFSGSAVFGGARFSGSVRFGGTRFSGSARFEEVRFSGSARFGGAEFGGSAWFTKTRFSGTAGFGGARFGRDAVFEGAQFSGDAVFTATEFGRDAVFTAAQFGRAAIFMRAQFTNGNVWFTEAQFQGNAGFEETQFNIDPDFTDATVSRPTNEHTWPEGWQVEQLPRLDTARLVRQP
jgi:uncharacterized protein YjbI with pentapeptide repeats